MTLLEEISLYIQNGKAKKVRELVQLAIDSGIEAKVILNEGLLTGMSIIGAKFKNNEIFVPEVLVASRAMNVGLSTIESLLEGYGDEPIGRVVIGTVKGDLHDIGKNLVTMMLKGAGFEVHDVGVDVDAEIFINKAEEVKAEIICMSALLTTTMTNMEACINILNEKGIRDKYIVMVGGAPLNDKYASQIGADYYTPDAATAAEVARLALLVNKNQNSLIKY